MTVTKSFLKRYKGKSKSKEKADALFRLERDMKIKLNHKCIYCEKDIFLGERIILSPRPFHLDCGLNKLKDEFEKYSIDEKQFKIDCEIIDKIFGDLK